jgi:hypothetical protein
LSSKKKSVDALPRKNDANSYSAEKKSVKSNELSSKKKSVDALPRKNDANS